MTRSSENILTDLAALGGRPVRTTPVAPWPCFADDEIEAVERVLRSGRANYWTGDEGAAFEREFAEFVGAKYAIALANGTVALELALHALDIGPGDDVVVPSRSFFATASCVVARRARPVFADVNSCSGNVSRASLAAALTPNTRAIIVVHLAGWPCDMDPILELAAEHRITVIEDCAQSHGANYRNHVTGSLGSIGAFSFCQDKIMTTGGEGGMLVTDDERIWRRAWEYKDHGKDYDAVFHTQHGPGFRWLHESFGTNGRMTEMQAAIGRRQLPKLGSWLSARRKNAHSLEQQLAHIPELSIPLPPSGSEHAYYKLYAYLDTARLARDWSRDRVVESIAAEGVPCFAGGCSEIYLEKAFNNTTSRPAERLPIARRLGETSLMFLVHPTLTEEHIADTARAVHKVLRVATAR